MRLRGEAAGGAHAEGLPDVRSADRIIKQPSATGAPLPACAGRCYCTTRVRCCTPQLFACVPGSQTSTMSSLIQLPMSAA